MYDGTEFDLAAEQIRQNSTHTPHFMFWKAEAIRRVLEGHPTVFYVDLDAYFTPLACSFPLHRYFYPSKNIQRVAVVSADQDRYQELTAPRLVFADGWTMNAGVMGWRQGEWTDRIIQAWFAEGFTDRYTRHPFDQAGFCFMQSLSHFFALMFSGGFQLLNT